MLIHVCVCVNGKLLLPGMLISRTKLQKTPTANFAGMRTVPPNVNFTDYHEEYFPET